MRLALRPLRRLSLAASLAALATLGACSILPEAQVLQVYLLPVHNPPAVSYTHLRAHETLS
ncbi:hypothetical protein FA323_18890, partial [Pseudomonas aeruginosa]|nr:hypothetical protein [Pseudomonas aeruginosa]